MKACWIDAGNDPAYEKLRAHGIDAVYFDAREGRLTTGYLDEVASHGFRVGFQADSEWNNWTPGTFAKWVSDRMLDIGWKGNAAVCLDIERHDPAWIVACLKAWRVLRPYRRTDWTLEPFQGGLFNGHYDAVQAIANLNVGVAPQYYTGSMLPVAPDRVLLDLMAYGFRWDRIFGVYDAARVGGLIAWEGYAYTQGRLA